MAQAELSTGMSLALADPVADIIVVGGGPAGLSVATRIRRKSVVLVNASERPGWPPHCTGLVSPWTAEGLGGRAVTEVFEAAVFMDDVFRERCRIYGRPLAVRVSRPVLEELMAEDAASLGHRILNNMRVDAIRSRCVHVGGRGWLCAREAVVIATGFSSFSRLFGARCDTLPGLEVRVRLARRIREDVFITIHGYRFAPEFFAWIVPVNHGREALVGLASGSDTAARLTEFLHNAERRGVLSIASVLSHRGGAIVRGPPAKTIVAGDVYGIGDVVCASKPFTGGGLYSIALLAPWVARAIDEGMRSRLEEAWMLLRRELVAQRELTRLAVTYRGLWWLALTAACSLQDRCRIDYDRHSSLLGCLLGGARLGKEEAAERDSRQGLWPGEG